MDDETDYDLEDLRSEQRARQRYHQQLMRHPHPQDPDYPGETAKESDDELY